MSRTKISSLYVKKHLSLAISLFAIPAMTNATTHNDSSGSWALEEVIVTAQKRAQNTQDIGISIAALSGDSLQKQGISQAQDLAKVIPNVSSLNVSGGGVPVIIIRGIGLQNFRINDSPTTAFYVDDVYQSSIASADFTMFDLERIEVLKGPQGGLYGRNTISGAVQIISKKPSTEDEVNGFLHAEYGSYNRRELEGAIGLPISADSALRISGRWEKSGDTQFKSVTNDFKHGEVDRWAARAIFSSELANDSNLTLKLHGGADNSELPLLQPVGIFADQGVLGGTPPHSNVGVSTATQTLCAAVLQGLSNRSNCTYNTNANSSDYGIDGHYDSAADFGGFLDNNWLGTSLKLQTYPGNFQLTSISAFDSIDYRRFADLDGLPIEYTHVDYNTEIDSWSQEFRLAYDEGDNLSWVIGINYAQDDVSESSQVMGKDGLMPIAFNGAQMLDQSYQQKTTAKAAYSHIEWILSDNWNLIGEARYTKANKSFDGVQTLSIPSLGVIPFLGGSNSVAFEDLSGKLAIQWTPQQNLMLFSSLSQGFKTGGFFGGFVTNPAQFAPYDSESILALEGGFKSDWLENRLRLNGSVFVYKRKDVQQSATDSRGVVSVTRLTNVGDVDVTGTELDIVFKPIQSLSLQIGLGYTDSEISESDLSSATLTGLAKSSIEGTNTPNYSKFSANFLGQYENPITDELNLRLQLEISYRSKRDLNLVTTPLESEFFTEPRSTITNIRTVIGPQDESWKATLFVDNIGDERYRVLLRDNGLRGFHTLYSDPRTWGLSFTYNW